MKLRSPAKINLYLEVVGARTDGYSNVVLLLQSIALSDLVTLQPHREIAIECNHPLVPCNQHNLAYKAARLLQEYTGYTAGVAITIDKKIPVAAGLAGGSGNGAAVLVGLNQLWQLGLSELELATLAAKLGSDVPFCLKGGTQLGFGRGEQLAILPSPDARPVLLVKPRTFGVSTAWAYQTFRAQNFPASQGKLGTLLCHLAPTSVLNPWLYNDLERVVLPAHPQLQGLAQQLMDKGAERVLMSGSGPTMFVLPQDEDQAHQLAQTLNPVDYDIFVTNFHAQGIEVVG
jgi:4-diphosphocytidyl-2-C-methyl-D-erythritol kinase